MVVQWLPLQPHYMQRDRMKSTLDVYVVCWVFLQFHNLNNMNITSADVSNCFMVLTATENIIYFNLPVSFPS